jgi:hypothetical protein
MCEICSDTNGDYVKGANIAGCKVADAMLAQGWCKFLDIQKAASFGQKAFFWTEQNRILCFITFVNQ